MSAPSDDDDDVERALERIADFDRQESSVEAAPVVGAEAELSSREQNAILRRVLDQREPTAGDIPLPVPPQNVRWLTATAAVVLGLAAAFALWIARSQPEPAIPGVGGSVVMAPHRLELGGTARVLGGEGTGPRAYGPGDDFVLRVVPLHPPAGATQTEARLFSLRDAEATERPLDMPMRPAADGVIEFYGEVAESLSPGRWLLRVELGSLDACADDSKGCARLDVAITIVGG